MADCKTMTHAAGSEVNMDFLAGIAESLGGAPEVVAEIRSANTARHVLELSARAGLTRLTDAICERVVTHLQRHASTVAPLAVHAILVDFDGRVMGRAPALSPAFREQDS
jgi:cobalt-precorrin-5B (C1)-methyltransferase